MLKNRHGYNPDVLDCIANLSNDEVFTSPKLANEMLDMLPQELFESPDTKFLDPACKSGVFLREITKRLDRGLENIIPDRQERINHILHKQVFGVAITELTAQLSRRTLYCSKYACAIPSNIWISNNEDTEHGLHEEHSYSISEFTAKDVNGFCINPIQGNIRFNAKCRHSFVEVTDENGNPKKDLKTGKILYKPCSVCGASRDTFDHDGKNPDYEHAHEFIHMNDKTMEELKKMQFDVIISNPPYQLTINTETKQAKPIYHKFVEQAKKLQPKYLAMIVPSRWYSGGIGLDEFRNTMMNDRKISKLVDYSNAKDCFAGNSIGGGVCYFLRDESYDGECEFTNIKGGIAQKANRFLNEFDVLVRYNEAVPILHKISDFNEECFDTIVSPLMPFGLPSNYRGEAEKTVNKSIALYSSKDITYISEDEIPRKTTYLNKYKIFMSKVGAEHAGEPSKDGTFGVITSSIKIVGPNSACTHSYFVLGENDDIKYVENVMSYIKTKFVRFLMLLAVSSINLSKSTFCFVPMQDFSKSWTDAELYEKYGLTQDEIDFIESMIKPMGNDDTTEEVFDTSEESDE